MKSIIKQLEELQKVGIHSYKLDEAIAIIKKGRDDIIIEIGKIHSTNVVDYDCVVHRLIDEIIGGKADTKSRTDRAGDSEE